MTLLALALVALPFMKSSEAPPGARAAYPEAKTRLIGLRTELGVELRRAKRKKDKEKILDRASAGLEEAITKDLIPAWLGTPWSFSGTSTAPGQGSIACGMFVGTVLADAGFNLDRIAIGRLASEHIARSLAGARNVRRYSDADKEAVLAELLEQGEGLYLVGLDFHAGFIWVDGERRARFIHSSIWPPRAVASEPLLGDNPFSYSRYRVTAKLLDRAMAERWILGQHISAVAR
jgi:hypothetical protein